ncbi:MAG: uncharacterized protein KVP18_001357 [Porospora cf. gigantea A]|uniref:uncharacterized protein n=1 Tax=Porospora cf. gigantea A TaxID=2853593 RepID=UPI0035593FC0|nr:MAG: hypothetical protein KVP18_001357 [Porospora cf. gigantea A]
MLALNVVESLPVDFACDSMVNIIPVLNHCDEFLYEVTMCDWCAVSRLLYMIGGVTAAILASFFCFVPFYTDDQFSMMVEEDLVEVMHGKPIYE